MASVKQEVNAVWTVLLRCRGLMGHSGLDFFCSPSPQEVVRGRWSEAARTTGITTSAQTRVKRRGDDESRYRRLRTNMTSEVTCLAREDEF